MSGKAPYTQAELQRPIAHRMDTAFAAMSGSGAVPWRFSLTAPDRRALGLDIGTWNGVPIYAAHRARQSVLWGALPGRLVPMALYPTEAAQVALQAEEAA